MTDDTSEMIDDTSEITDDISEMTDETSEITDVIPTVVEESNRRWFLNWSHLFLTFSMLL